MSILGIPERWQDSQEVGGEGRVCAWLTGHPSLFSFASGKGVPVKLIKGRLENEGDKTS